jgi:hypothetical protein
MTDWDIGRGSIRIMGTVTMADKGSFGSTALIWAFTFASSVVNMIVSDDGAC